MSLLCAVTWDWNQNAVESVFINLAVESDVIQLAPASKIVLCGEKGLFIITTSANKHIVEKLRANFEF